MEKDGSFEALRTAEGGGPVMLEIMVFGILPFLWFRDELLKTLFYHFFPLLLFTLFLYALR